MTNERKWPDKYEFVERLPASTHGRAGILFDSLSWTLNDAPCAALRHAREALTKPGNPDFVLARVLVEAAIRTVHAGGDLLAQLVDACLLKPPLRGIWGMNSKCFGKRLAAVEPVLARGFDTFRNGNDSWVYVSGVTNSLKHRQTLPMEFSLPGNLTIPAFGVDGRPYAEKSFDDIEAAVYAVQAGLWELFWQLYDSLKSGNRVD